MIESRVYLDHPKNAGLKDLSVVKDWMSMEPWVWHDVSIIDFARMKIRINGTVYTEWNTDFEKALFWAGVSR